MKNSYRLIQGDCLDVLPTVARESVDLVVTSPPYFNLKPQQQKFGKYENYRGFLADVFMALYQTIRHQGKVCINISDIPLRENGRRKLISFSSDIYNLCLSCGFEFWDRIFWHDYNYANAGRNNSGSAKSILASYPYPSNLMVAYNMEYILVFRKVLAGHPKKQWSSEIKEQSKLTKEEWRTLCQDYWRFPSVSRSTGHPAPYPEELARRLIRLYSFVDEIVLDPFMGSGTTMKVAQDLERDCLGIEINPEYCELTKKRCFGRTFLGREPPEYKFEVFA